MILTLLLLFPAQTSERVGRLGEPDSLVVEGASAFDPWDVHRALLADLEVAVAGHPLAEKSNYLKVLAERALLGCSVSGYFGAKAEAKYDPDGKHVRLRVVEGPRSKIGGVHVVGAVRRSGAEIEGALARSFWKKGAEVDATTSSLDKRNEAVKAELANVGYFFPTFSTSVKICENGATLEVAVRNEGPSNAIDEILVLGATRHSRATLLEFLQLASGQKITGRRLEELDRKLRDSGRFFEHHIAPRENLITGQIDLLLQLAENRYAPELGKPFSERQAAFLQTYRLLEELRSGGDDLLLEWEVPSLKLQGAAVASFGKGLLVDAAIAEGVRLTARWGPVLWLGTSSGLMEANRPNAVTAQLDAVLQAARGTQPGTWSSSLSFRIRSSNDPDEQKNEVFAMRCQPACALRDAERWKEIENTTCRRIYRSQEYSIVCDPRTGRPIEWRLDGPAKASLRQRRGEFDHRAATFSSAKRLPWTFESATAKLLEVTQCRRFAIRPNPERDRLVRGIFGSEDARSGSRNPAKLEYNIPSVVSWQFLSPEFLLTVIDAAFLRSSSLSKLLRETVFQSAGKSNHGEAVLYEIFSDRNAGPLLLFSAAELARYSSPGYAPIIARQAKSILADAGFERDLDLLLGKESRLGPVVVKAIELLRTFQPDEVERVIALAPEKHRGLWRSSLAHLRDQTKAPEAAARAACFHLWRTVLKAAVADRLDLIIVTAPPTPEAQKPESAPAVPPAALLEPLGKYLK